MSAKPDEVRDGVALTNLDQPLFDGADATKRELVDYLDGVADRLVPALRDRPLSVIRVHRGQEAFMQKNLPKYAPEWIQRVNFWAEASKRDVAYALCNDKKTLLWFANQRAVEYHPTLMRLPPNWSSYTSSHDVYEDQMPNEVTHLVLDLDPPPDAGFPAAVRVAHAVRATLDETGLAAAVKTSGAKGVHVFVPVAPSTSSMDAARATHALAERTARANPDIATTAFMKADRGGKVFVDATRAGGATVVSVYSPRARPGTPVSWPVAWDDLDSVSPTDFTIRNALALLGDRDPWTELHPPQQSLPPELIAEGAEVPNARVEAMHEGGRRARARKASPRD